MSKYEGATPGPWRMYDANRQKYADNQMVVAPNMPPRNYGDNGEFTAPHIVCQVGLYTNASTHMETIANARLIADAPMLAEQNERMLEALRPFAHPDLYKMHTGNAEGDASPVFGRDKAILTIGDFKRAAELIAEVEASHVSD